MEAALGQLALSMQAIGLLLRVPKPLITIRVAAQKLHALLLRGV